MNNWFLALLAFVDYGTKQNKSEGKIIPHGQPESWYHSMERTTRSSVRYDNLVEWRSRRWWSKAPSERSSQSLHHCSVSYHPWHTSDLTTDAYPCNRNQEHKKELEEHNQNCVDYEVGSHKPMNNDTISWQIWSKQNPKPNVAAADKIKVMGVQNPWRYP
jgi:hypothetical protein